MNSILLNLWLVATISAEPTIHKRGGIVSGTANVYLDQNIRIPQHLASGFINGIPATTGQIPDHFYQDIKFQWARSSGGQITPAGWTAGIAGYNARYASAIHDWQVATTQGGKFIMPLHNLWGWKSNIYPGDNGNWTEFDIFLNHLIANWTSSGAGPTTGLVTELWNEVDIQGDWNRSQSQWLDMWGNAYHKLKADVPGLQIVGPSHVYGPSISNNWWSNWAQFIKNNASVPDHYCWHFETGSGDMETWNSTLGIILDTYGLLRKPILLSEYATQAEQNPSGAAWFISQLERHDAIGLRGNWFSGAALHDYMAGLVGKPNAGTSSYSSTQAGYWPTAEFQVYKYYAQNMTGYRVNTTATADRTGEIYATVGDGKVRLLTGTRTNKGSWAVTVNGLTSLGFPINGTISVRTLVFPGNSNQFAEHDAPVDLGWASHTYTMGSLTYAKSDTDGYTARAQEFYLP